MKKLIVLSALALAACGQTSGNERQQAEASPPAQTKSSLSLPVNPTPEEVAGVRAWLAAHEQQTKATHADAAPKPSATSAQEADASRNCFKRPMNYDEIQEYGQLTASRRKATVSRSAAKLSDGAFREAQRSSAVLLPSC
jgi:hypothetical protein